MKYKKDDVVRLIPNLEKGRTYFMRSGPRANSARITCGIATYEHRGMKFKLLGANEGFYTININGTRISVVDDELLPVNNAALRCESLL